MRLTLSVCTVPSAKSDRDDDETEGEQGGRARCWRRHEVTAGLLRRLVGRLLIELHGGERENSVRATDVSGCAMSVARWSQTVRIPFLYHYEKSKNDVTASGDLNYGLRFFAPAAKCCV